MRPRRREQGRSAEPGEHDLAGLIGIFHEPLIVEQIVPQIAAFRQ